MKPNKIQIKINHSHLKALLTAFDLFEWSHALTPPQKAVKSICDELYSGFYKKEIDKRDNPREFTMNFKYYQAHALHDFTSIASMHLPGDSFERNALSKINRQIHQQL